MADVPAAAAPIEAQRLVLLLPDGSRVPIGGSLTIGRGEQANIRIADQTVSRVHARIGLSPDGPVIEDAGSRFGTMLSGNAVDGPTRLYPGAQIRVGDVVIGVAAEEPAPARMDVPSVEPVRELDAGPGETIVVPVDATLMGLRAAPNPALSLDGRLRPRVRSGWALKRLAADEGEERFVLRDLEGGSFVRMDADDAALFKLLDGNRTVTELLSEAEQLVGPTGPGRLARLIADLADRGLLDGVGAAPAAVEPESALARILKPRDKTVTWVGDYFERAYHHWGRVFFSPLSVTFLALFALAGFGAFAYIVGARFGTPFVVANRLAIGGAVFVAGRFAWSRCMSLRTVWRWLITAGARSRRPAPGPDLSVRVRRHERGVLRVARASHRDQRRRAGVRPDARRAVLVRVLGRSARLDLGRVLPAGVRRVRGRVLQPEPVPGSGRLSDPRRLPA